uniref:Early transcription factor large subunit-like protein n=1 Tax=Pithovirus LCPAC406 TaxID=2506599 RepID=A0A481ZCZ6_9VIRU|nr:MAG: uncharacterized protein LCPAC406_01370 [Pithovirus LCPAC406]
MESFEDLREQGLNQGGFKGRDITHLFDKNTNINASRSGWELFLEIGGLSPDEYIIAIYTLLDYKKIKEPEKLEKYDKTLSEFHSEASRMACRNELDDETSLKYKLIILTSSTNINHLIRWTPEYNEHRQLLRELIINKGYTIEELSEKGFNNPQYLHARTLKDEGYSMDGCSAALYSEWRNIHDVMKKLIDDELTLSQIYELLSFHWPDKINVAMLYFSIRLNVDEIKDFINDGMYNVAERYKSWVRQEYISRGNDMKLLSKLLGYQNVIIDLELFKSTAFIISSFRSIYSLEIRPKDGIRLFDKMKVSEGIPFIYYRESGENVYSKVYRSGIKRSILSASNTAIPGKIYINIWIEKSIYSMATYTVKTNELELTVQEIYQIRTIELLENAFSSLLIQTKKTKIRGSFAIYSVEFDRSSFLDVILNDSVLNKYLYVDDSTSTIKTHVQLKFTSTMGTTSGYKTYDDTSTERKKSVLRCNVEYMYTEPGDKFLIESRNESKSGKVTTKLVNYESKERENMINFTVSDSDNIDIITSFIETMRRLITIYDRYEIKYEYSFLLDNYIPTVAKPFVQQKTTSARKRRSGKIGEPKTKLQRLTELDDVLFASGYARLCPPSNQPISISESEAKVYKGKGNVLKFPNIDGEFYYFIGSVKYPFVGVKPNRTKSVNVYSHVPCLYVAKQDVSIKKWRAGEAIKKKKSSQKITLTSKILPFLIQGVLSPKLDKLVSVGDEQKDVEYRRLGMIDSKSSFLQCLLEAVMDREYNNAKDKLKYVHDLRVQMAQEINLGVLKQELYDLAEEEIRKDLEDVSVFLDPRLHFRVLEELFGVTVYTFTKQGELEIPRYRIHHIKPYKKRNVVMIYKDEEQCELIFSTVRVYSHKIKPLHSLFLRAHGTYTWSIAEQSKTKFYLREDLYSSVYFYGYVLKSYATHQYIDNYGKVRGFLTKVNDIEIFIAIIPSEPVNIPMLNERNFMPPQPNVREILDIFKHISPSGFNSHGIWYPILDIRYGIFVYAIGGIDEVNNTPPDPLGWYKSGSAIDDKRQIVLNVVLQFINWIYSIYLLDDPFGNIDGFFSLYVSTGGEYKEYDISGIKDHNFLPHDVNIYKAIEFVSLAVPSLVRDKRLWMYCDAFDVRIRYHLKETFSMILKKKIPEKIVGQLSFFREDVNTVLIIGDRNLRNWIKDELREGRISLMIKDKVDSHATEPYMYKSYLVQNTSNLRESLAIALHWNRYSINMRQVEQMEIINADHVIYSENEGKLVVIETNFVSSSSYLEVIKYSSDEYGALLPMF